MSGQQTAQRRLPELSGRTLTHAFRRAVDRRPDDTAHVDPTGSWTFAEAYDRCRRLAGGLARLGVGPGERVAGVLDNSFDAVHLYFGLGLTGRIQVPINTAFKGTFLSHVINDSGAGTVVIEAAYYPRLLDIAADVPDVTTVVVRGGDVPPDDGPFRVVGYDELLEADPAEVVPAEPWDIQAYIYTSGTTGSSKGVRVTHAQAYTYSSREDSAVGQDGGRTLVLLPLFHLAGQMFGVYQALIHGARCVLHPFTVTAFWSLVKEHGITDTVLLGGMAEMITKQPALGDDADNPLALVHMAPLVADVPAFAERFGVLVGSVYGSTEAGCPIVGEPDTIVGGECGYPRAGFQCRIVDEHDRPVPAGVTGELVIRAEEPWTTFDGHVGRPEATVEACRNQWFHSGDGFRADETGRYFFVDRIKDSLRRRGENISSFEVEKVLSSHPDVLESAAVAVPSDLAEDEIKAVLVVADQATFDPAPFIEFLIPRMPYFMVPRYVEIVTEMPRTPTQKIQKNLLRRSGVTDAWDREAAGITVSRDS